MKCRIDKIIKESIDKFILNERLSSVLYHFTGIGGLYHILKSDSFKLKSSYGRMSDDMHKTKKFYLSCTRQRSGLLGYSRNLNVRISLDGDLLNQNYEGGAVDYWGTSMGKQSYYDKEKYNKVDYFQPSTENEDRIFSEFPIIKHASRYIKRVDILLKNKDNKIRLNYMYHILRSKFNKIIYIYDNENDFNYQTNNIINSEIFDSSSSYDSIPNDMRFSNSISYGLSHMLSFFVLVDGRYKDYKEYSAKLLKKYGLDDYISKVLNDINIHMNINHVDSTILDGIRTNDGGDVYEKSFLMLRDFLRNHGFSNINDAIKFVKKRNENRYGGIYDEEKIVNVFAFTPNGNNDDDMSNIIILHPDKTLFWDIEQFKYNKKYFINDIERNIRSHKSGSDEKFHKYLQHMVKGKITVSDMLSFLSRLDTEEEDIIEYLFGGSFRNINVKFYRIKYYKYVNETDKEELKEMFRA